MRPFGNEEHCLDELDNVGGGHAIGYTGCRSRTGVFDRFEKIEHCSTPMPQAHKAKPYQFVADGVDVALISHGRITGVSSAAVAAAREVRRDLGVARNSVSRRATTLAVIPC